jgi:hypothetical protein
MSHIVLSLKEMRSEAPVAEAESLLVNFGDPFPQLPPG